MDQLVSSCSSAVISATGTNTKVSVTVFIKPLCELQIILDHMETFPRFLRT